MSGDYSYKLLSRNKKRRGICRLLHCDYQYIQYKKILVEHNTNMTPNNNSQGRFENFNWDRAEKYLFGGFGVFIVFFAIWFGYVNVRRNSLPYKITLAAGEKTGASYIIGEALARVAKEHTNIRINVCKTDSTEDNTKSLKDDSSIAKAECSVKGEINKTEKIEAQLVTAQEDIIPGSSARIVANLYQDYFHLLVKFDRAKKIKKLPENIEDFSFDDLHGLAVDMQKGGGQIKSLQKVARHFHIENRFIPLYSQGDKAQALFRLCILRNKEISDLIKSGWKLVPINQVDAMNQTKFLRSEIPKGFYQGSPPIPKLDLETIAVQRNLLARKDVPDWVIEKIALILNENRKEIKEEIRKIAKEREKEKNQGKPDNTFDPEAIYTLLNHIKRPKDNGDVQIHRGALSYYDRHKPSFIQENADYLALILTLILLIRSWLLGVNVWRNRLKEHEANEKVDRYIEQVVDLMIFDTQSQGSSSTIDQRTKSFAELFQQQQKLNQVFKQASHSLDIEEISQSGFRVFSEAYKSAREVLGQTIEDTQREFVSSYVNQLKELLKRLDAGENQDLLLRELEQIRNEATDKLLQKQIFSRQSFQTFVETYNFIRDAIQRSV